MSNETTPAVKVRIAGTGPETEAVGAVPVREPEAAGMLPRVKSALELVVAVATVVYALGYLCWALFSWDQGFGLPPALEGQYLIAGAVPALLLVALAFGLVGLRHLLRRDRQISARDKRVGQWLQYVATAAVIAGFVVGRITGDGSPLTALIFAGVAMFGAAAFFSSDKLDQFFARGISWYLLIVAPVMVVALIQLYVTRVFRFLPSEFGGPALAAVRLDLKKDELAPETLALLMGGAVAEGETLRTRALRVVMAPGDFYLVMLDGSPGPSHVKLRADTVRAITPER